MSEDKPLPCSPVTHGWIRPVRHLDLGVEVDGQSAVQYMRFGRDVRVDRLELKPGPSGRWIPAVPTHPAHVVVSTLDDASGDWRLVKDVELPSDPRIAGEGLNASMTTAEMDEVLLPTNDTTHVIELGGLATDLLRVECDREHPVWPSHGECNGSPFSVPFSILDNLIAFGESPAGDMPQAPYRHPLQVGTIDPAAPDGMAVDSQPWQVLYRSDRFSVGFSLIRPEILHLGWDGTGSGRVDQNRVQKQSRGYGWYIGQSGPLLRVNHADFGASQWTGTVDVAGNQVRYTNVNCGEGVSVDATFTVTADGFRVELTQRADHEVRAIEWETWRLAWDCGTAMTAAAAEPTLQAGRNGEVKLPMYWAGDGNGCLRCEKVSGDGYLQVESFRSLSATVGGIVLGDRPGVDQCQTIPSGTRTGVWEFSVAAFAPAASVPDDTKLPAALRRHWGSVYSCFRPEKGGFSNNAISTNCHVNQHAPMEIAAFTQATERGPDPLGLYRFTIERALLAGGGYGFWRNLYLDSDPILVSGAGRIHQARPDESWLRRIDPGLVQAARRILSTIGPEGLAICRDLSGNSGSYRWSSNAFDVVGFGHMDGYVNAWTYRGLLNAAPMLTALGHSELAQQCTTAANNLRSAYAVHLLNPETGWVAGWRSRDGQLHDAAFLWVNGVACAFGLLPDDVAVEALRRLEHLRKEVGAGHAHFGLPFNLCPLAAEDHMLPLMNGRFTSTFENYTDGSMGTHWAIYYLRALQSYGLTAEANSIVADMEAGYGRGHFNGGVGSGVEFYRWDGVPTGYEGTFVGNWEALYAIAIHHGVIEPTTPEWWPPSA